MLKNSKRFLAILLAVVMSCSMLTLIASAEETDLLPYQDPTKSVEERVADLLPRMTTEEKIAQTVQVNNTAIMKNGILKEGYENWLTENMYGSMLNGGSDPANPNPENYEQTSYLWRNQINVLQEQASRTRLGIPILYGVDAVHGFNGFLGATVFPHNIALGATGNEELVEEIGRVTAAETGAMGYYWTFAPCSANPQNPRWGRTYEGFSSDIELTSKLTAAAIRGLQGTDPSKYSDPTTIAATVKHLGFEGWCANGGNKGNAILIDDYKTNEEYINNVLMPELAAYKTAIDEGVLTLMPSYNYITTPSNTAKEYAHESYFLLTEILRNRLGFEGMVIGDYGGHTSGVTGTFMYPVDQYPELNADRTMQTYRKHIACFNAGVDMFMNGSASAGANCVASLKYGIENGYITMARLDEAVERILTLKFKLGLFDENRYIEEDNVDTLHTEEHKAVARQAVRESLVMLKNDNQIVNQLSSMDKIFVAGEHANSLRLQAGGWTISWTSAPATWEGPQFGTTILDGFKQNSAADFVYSADGTGSEGCEAAIVVVGENPYAEGGGDRRADQMGLIRTQDQAVFENIKAENPDIPVIFVLISGRPLIVTEYIEQSDAFIAAWLPGTEGDGIGQVLFNDEYDFKGRLSMNWPASIDGLTTEATVIPEKPELDNLYEIGDGLVKFAEPQVSAPEDVFVNENFEIEVKLPTEYSAVKLVNETGRTVAIQSMNIDNGTNLTTWNLTTAIGTAGEGRQLTVMARTLFSDYEEVGTITINVTVPEDAADHLATVKSVAFQSKTVKVNTPVQLVVRTSTNASSTKLYNENARTMGKSLVSKSVSGSTITWTYDVSIGTAGARSFSATAVNTYGIENLKAPVSAAITVTK